MSLGGMSIESLRSSFKVASSLDGLSAETILLVGYSSSGGLSLLLSGKELCRLIYYKGRVQERFYFEYLGFSVLDSFDGYSKHCRVYCLCTLRRFADVRI